MSQFKEEKVSSQMMFEGKIITVTKDEARLVNGSVHTREVVHHNGGASVLALNEKCEVALVRQWRYAAEKETIEIPAGKIEPGEDPRNTAIRELSEEAGVIADTIADLGQIMPTCAYCTEIIYIYIATGLRQTNQHLDEDEFVSVFWMPLSQAIDLVLDGTIDDAKTAYALMRAKIQLDNGTIAL